MQAHENKYGRYRSGVKTREVVHIKYSDYAAEWRISV
jgi:hypothetical protein